MPGVNIYAKGEMKGGGMQGGNAGRECREGLLRVLDKSMGFRHNFCILVKSLVFSQGT